MKTCFLPFSGLAVVGLNGKADARYAKPNLDLGFLYSMVYKVEVNGVRVQIAAI